jgi:hypothetical protein
MKLAKILGIVLVVYVAIVAIFESLIGTMQPAGDGTLVITTYDADGAAHDRVVSKVDVDGALYVAANHWPRAWYSRALAKPEVEATIDGAKRAYRAVPVTGDEHEHVNTRKKLGTVFRVLTGFPPRYFLRLDPR